MAGLLRTRIALLCGQNILKQYQKYLPCIQQTVNISSKAFRELNGIKRPPPYDYRNKGYGLISSWFDKTSKRLDDNSKVILVEGPIAAGKTEFAKSLADELDMHYIPQATMDDVYINEYGYDMRELDKLLPPGAQSFDEKRFVNDPKGSFTAALQLNMFGLKFGDYIDALAHLFSTGQGVVIERSAFSDIVFVEALYRNNLITKKSYKGLIETHINALGELLKPHLVIYLDVPVNVTLEKIKKRNKFNEANSPLFKDTKFLETMEDVYKNNFLKDISTHSELLVYDWSNGGETELVVEDIERIDFDSYEKESPKMMDWRFFTIESDWTGVRMKYTEDRHITHSYCNLPLYHCPDLLIQAEDLSTQTRIFEQAKGNKYGYGYDPAEGDKDLLFKTKTMNNPKHKNFDF